MKKIILTVSNDLTYDQRMHKIGTSLSDAGSSVLLVGRKRRQSQHFHSPHFKTHRISCLFTKGSLFYAAFNIRLFFFLLFTPFDIVCAVDLDTILGALSASRLKGKKVVYDAHEYFSEVPELINRNRTKKIWEHIASFSIPKMHACYTVNEVLAKVLSERYKTSFQVIRNVPLLIEQDTNQQEEKRIIYQGAVNKGRGLELLLEAMKQMDDFLLANNVRLIIAGDGDISNQINQLVTKLGLEKKVEITGYLLPDRLKEMTQKAFIGYNLLEKESKSYYYSLSNKFFDYMHAEIPSLSNNFPAYVQINEKFEVTLLTELKVEEIVQSIKRLIEDKELYQKLQQNCRLAKQEYNWQKEEKHLLDVYRKL
jgi:glycosyltransferase involved in cell wall biosynthesis